MKYLGITIGPIVETLGYATSPAGLWCASGIFSHITREICRYFYEECQNNVEIIIPNPINPNSQDAIKQFPESKDGIGKFPDRIFLKILKEDNNFIERMNHEFNKIIKDLASEIDDTIENTNSYSFLKDYIQINYIYFNKKDEKKNIILAYSHYLDNLELIKTFPENPGRNPLFKLFTGEEEKGNIIIKKLPFMKNLNSCQLWESNNKNKIKDLESISSNGNGIKKSELKKYHYFAVVQADGDSMSKVLDKIPQDQEIKKFSFHCMEYATLSAKEIKEYGGVTIYAGGDDLLFLAPVENKKNENIFTLCEKLQNVFNDTIQKYVKGLDLKDVKPSVSFGISINYYKYPLYEALNDAINLLFTNAKHHNNDKKNAISFNLNKSSGNRMGITITNDSEVLKDFKDLIKEKVKFKDEEEEKNITDRVINSVIFSIDKYKKVYLNSLINEEVNLKYVFKNMYDGPEHNLSEDYLEKVKNLLEKIYNEDDNIIKINNSEDLNKIKAEKSISILLILLRVVKFFSEKEVAK